MSAIVLMVLENLLVIGTISAAIMVALSHRAQVTAYRKRGRKYSTQPAVAPAGEFSRIAAGQGDSRRAISMAHDVFISYPHQDKAVADAVCARLEAQNIRCWIAPRDVAPSVEWAASIVEAIKQCRLMVLIFSEHANRSKQVHREVQRAFDDGKPVMPFRIQDVAPEGALAYYMPAVHWLDALTPHLEQHLEELAQRIKALLQVPSAQTFADSKSNLERAPKIVVKARRPPKRWPIAAAALGLCAIAVLAGGWRYLTREPTPSSNIQSVGTAVIYVPSGSVDCSEEKNLRSQDATDPTTMAFINKAADTKRIYWLDYGGARVLYATLQTGQAIDTQTYMTHPWVVANSSDVCQAIYMPAMTAQNIEIDN